MLHYAHLTASPALPPSSARGHFSIAYSFTNLVKTNRFEIQRESLLNDVRFEKSLAVLPVVLPDRGSLSVYLAEASLSLSHSVVVLPDRVRSLSAYLTDTLSRISPE